MLVKSFKLSERDRRPNPNEPESHQRNKNKKKKRTGKKTTFVSNDKNHRMADHQYAKHTQIRILLPSSSSICMDMGMSIEIFVLRVAEYVWDTPRRYPNPKNTIGAFRIHFGKRIPFHFDLIELYTIRICPFNHHHHHHCQRRSRAERFSRLQIWFQFTGIVFLPLFG